MLKRILSVIVIMAVLLSLAACGEDNKTAGNTSSKASSQKAEDVSTKEEKAYLAYQTLNTKMGQSGEYDAEFIMTQEVAGVVTKTTGITQLKTVDGKQQMYMETNTNVAGQDIKVLVVTDGTKVYYEVNGQRMEMDVPDVLKEIDDVVAMPEFQSEAIKSCEVTEEGGNTKYSLVLDGNALTGLLDQMKESMAESMGDEEINMVLSDVSYVIVVDKNNEPKSMTMDMAIKMTVAGQEMEVKSNMEMTFKAFSGVTVNLADLAKA